VRLIAHNAALREPQFKKMNTTWRGNDCFERLDGIWTFVPDGVRRKIPAPLLSTTLSRHCHDSRGKTLKNRKQKVNTEEKLALAFHRNCLILLGKLPLRQIVIKLLKWLLTEMLEVRILPGEPTPFPLRI